ncbi:hypothetical protein GRF29_28g1833593 [Pseudopithomyces chartarum]|uniref:Uncharacterized protein n=1 Tax=Pseudopithomyces chartarum TaxID=1892770 RepID=A0AAN6RKW3_9PLEO|nr:hypothetical protein GRF29_28g1833593 [Pseudopithomyces chartarum]
MARLLLLSVAAVAHLAAAAPEPQITARADLHARADASILGYISTSGASEFSDLQSCDFPATLSQSGSYAQCCESGKPCHFYTSCSAGNAIAESTSVFCDLGFCNTAVIVSTAGAQNGKSNVGCWATTLGKDAFDLVQDIGTATPAPRSTQSSSDDESSNSVTPTGSATEPSETGSETETETPTETDASSSPTSDTAPSSSSPGAAAGAAKPLTGLVGLIAGLAALL